MSLTVCVAGATGWVGAPLCKVIAASEDLSLIGAVSRTQKDRNLSEVLNNLDIDLMVSGSVAEALEIPTDVLVDFTRPDIVKTNVMAAIERGVHVVIGTSGLTEDDLREIDAAAREADVGVIAAGNFAITAVLLKRFALEAARYLSHWEIIDYASATKVDAPSGTVRELAAQLAEVKTPEVIHPIEETLGERATRGATMNGSQIHSLRLPSYTIGVEIIFGENDERLTIRHDAGNGALPYLQGALLAIRKVQNHCGLVRGLEKILD